MDGVEPFDVTSFWFSWSSFWLVLGLIKVITQSDLVQVFVRHEVGRAKIVIEDTRLILSYTLTATVKRNKKSCYYEVN